MALLRAVLLREYRVRLEYWRRQLERAAENDDMEKLTEVRAYCSEYERMIADLSSEEQSSSA